MSDSTKPQAASKTMSNATSRRFYVLRCVGVIALSVVLPLVLALTVIFMEVRDKGAHSQPCKFWPNFSGLVEQDEIWLAELQGDTNIKPMATWLVPPPPDEVRLVRLNLITGMKTDTGLRVPNEHGEVFRHAESLYYVTNKSIFRQSGHRFVKLVDIPRGQNYYASLFKYRNQLTTIRQLDDGSHRLIHLVDDRWVDGRPILMPDQNRVWYDDAQRQRKSLLPLTSEQPVSGPSFGHYIFIKVVVCDDRVDVVSYNPLRAHREGFEFADERQETASALMPENGPQDITGWAPIDAQRGDRIPPTVLTEWSLYLSNPLGRILVAWTMPQSRLAIVSNDGQWTEFEIPLTDGWHYPDWVVGNPDEKKAYLFSPDQTWGSLQVRRLDAQGIHPTHLKVPGCQREYIARWQRLGLRLCLVWLLHLALVTRGTNWLVKPMLLTPVRSSNQQVPLAPLWRRSVATSFDVLLWLFAIGSFGVLSLTGIRFENPELKRMNVANGLLAMENLIYTELVSPFQNYPNRSYQLQELVSELHEQYADVMATGVLVSLVVFLLKVLVEGRYGVTPGKWMMGLRVVRMTLRPCGFGRALIRNVLYYVELPLLLTPIPAYISLMCSDRGQRLGDRLADTLVVQTQDSAKRK